MVRLKNQPEGALDDWTWIPPSYKEWLIDNSGYAVHRMHKDPYSSYFNNPSDWLHFTDDERSLLHSGANLQQILFMRDYPRYKDFSYLTPPSPEMKKEMEKQARRRKKTQ